MTVISPSQGLPLSRRTHVYTTPWHAPETDPDKTRRYQLRDMQNSLNIYLSGMCGEEVESHIYDQRDMPAYIVWEDAGGSRTNSAHWMVYVGIDALTTSDVMRIASKMLFTINKGVLESVTKRLQDHRVREVATVLESARTEWMGDMWFNSKMLDETRITELRLAKFRQALGSDVTLQDAVRGTAYNVPFSVPNPIIQGVLDRFGREIQQAVRSLDQSATLNLAIDIGNYLKWRENHGKDDGQSGTPDPQGQNGDSNQSGASGASGSANSPPSPGSGSPGQKGQESDAPQQPPPPPNEADFDDATAADRKRMKTNVKRTVTRRKKREAEVKSSESSREKRAKTQLSGSYYHPNQNKATNDQQDFPGAHSVEIRDIGGAPIELDDYTKLTLGSFMGNRLPAGQLRKSGSVSPRNAWKLSVKGDTRIFQKPPRTKGHVSILVDISGSMGCWCPSCVERNPGDIAAYLAWQVTGLLGQLHPTAEVFAYSGGNEATAKIVPLNAGEQPDGCAITDRLAGGTPTCTAMLYFQDHLKSRPSDTTAIIITDGAPDTCSGFGMTHVDSIGHQMMAEGIKFGTVFIGGGQYLNLPAEVSVNVSSLQDISKVQPLLEALDS